jgi:hypothetical protein
MKAERGSRGIAPLSLTLALDGMSSQRHALAALPLEKRSDTHCTGGWVGPRAGLDGCGNSLPPPGFDSRTVLPLASRYTDCIIQGHLMGKAAAKMTTHHHSLVKPNLRIHGVR